MNNNGSGYADELARKAQAAQAQAHKTSRPNSVPPRPTTPPAPRSAHHESKSKKAPKLKANLMGIGIIILLGLLVVGGIFLGRLFFGAGQIDSSKYQAVFLTSGQVYFGRLATSSNGDFTRLSDVFYIQASENDPSSPLQESAASSSNNLELIKLGSEVHGPEDEMLINNDQILFIENLKSDGKVSNSIQQYYDQIGS